MLPRVIMIPYRITSSHSNLGKQNLFHWYTSLTTIAKRETEPNKIDTTSQQTKPIKSRLLRVIKSFKVIIFPPDFNKQPNKSEIHQGMPTPPANTKDGTLQP